MDKCSHARPCSYPSFLNNIPSSPVPASCYTCARLSKSTNTIFHCRNRDSFSKKRPHKRLDLKRFSKPAWLIFKKKDSQTTITEPMVKFAKSAKNQQVASRRSSLKETSWRFVVSCSSNDFAKVEELNNISIYQSPYSIASMQETNKRSAEAFCLLPATTVISSCTRRNQHINASDRKIPHFSKPSQHQRIMIKKKVTSGGKESMGTYVPRSPGPVDGSLYAHVKKNCANGNPLISHSEYRDYNSTDEVNTKALLLKETTAALNIENIEQNQFVGTKQTSSDNKSTPNVNNTMTSTTVEVVRDVTSVTLTSSEDMADDSGYHTISTTVVMSENNEGTSEHDTQETGPSFPATATMNLHDSRARHEEENFPIASLGDDDTGSDSSSSGTSSSESSPSQESDADKEIETSQDRLSTYDEINDIPEMTNENILVRSSEDTMKQAQPIPKVYLTQADIDNAMAIVNECITDHEIRSGRTTPEIPTSQIPDTENFITDYNYNKVSTDVEIDSMNDEPPQFSPALPDYPMPETLHPYENKSPEYALPVRDVVLGNVPARTAVLITNETNLLNKPDSAFDESFAELLNDERNMSRSAEERKTTISSPHNKYNIESGYSPSSFAQVISSGTTSASRSKMTIGESMLAMPISKETHPIQKVSAEEVKTSPEHAPFQNKATTKDVSHFSTSTRHISDHSPCTSQLTLKKLTEASPAQVRFGEVKMQKEYPDAHELNQPVKLSKKESNKDEEKKVMDTDEEEEERRVREEIELTRQKLALLQAQQDKLKKQKEEKLKRHSLGYSTASPAVDIKETPNNMVSSTLPRPPGHKVKGGAATFKVGTSDSAALKERIDVDELFKSVQQIDVPFPSHAQQIKIESSPDMLSAPLTVDQTIQYTHYHDASPGFDVPDPNAARRANIFTPAYAHPMHQPQHMSQHHYQQQQQKQEKQLRKQREEEQHRWQQNEILRQQQEEKIRKQQEQEQFHKQQEEERLRLQRAEQLQKQKQAELLKKQQQQEKLRKQQEEERLQRQLQEEQLRKQKQADILRKQEEEEMMWKQKQQEQLLRQQHEQLLQQQQDEQLQRQRQEQLLKQQQEEHSQKQRQEEQLQRQQLEEERLRKQKHNQRLLEYEKQFEQAYRHQEADLHKQRQKEFDLQEHKRQQERERQEKFQLEFEQKQKMLQEKSPTSPQSTLSILKQSDPIEVHRPFTNAKAIAGSSMTLPTRSSKSNAVKTPIKSEDLQCQLDELDRYIAQLTQNFDVSSETTPPSTNDSMRRRSYSIDTERTQEAKIEDIRSPIGKATLPPQPPSRTKSSFDSVSKRLSHGFELAQLMRQNSMEREAQIAKDDDVFTSQMPQPSYPPRTSRTRPAQQQVATIPSTKMVPQRMTNVEERLAPHLFLAMSVNPGGRPVEDIHSYKEDLAPEAANDVVDSASPQTPGFPVSPKTPYVNSSSPTHAHIPAGLARTPLSELGLKPSLHPELAIEDETTNSEQGRAYLESATKQQVINGSSPATSRAITTQLSTNLTETPVRGGYPTSLPLEERDRQHYPTSASSFTLQGNTNVNHSPTNVVQHAPLQGRISQPGEYPNGNRQSPSNGWSQQTSIHLTGNGGYRPEKELKSPWIHSGGASPAASTPSRSPGGSVTFAYPSGGISPSGSRSLTGSNDSLLSDASSSSHHHIQHPHHAYQQQRYNGSNPSLPPKEPSVRNSGSSIRSTSTGGSGYLGGTSQTSPQSAGSPVSSVTGHYPFVPTSNRRESQLSAYDKQISQHRPHHPSSDDGGMSSRTSGRTSSSSASDIEKLAHEISQSNLSGASPPKFIRDTTGYWYKPDIGRDQALAMLRNRPAGSFVVRDSRCYPGAFGLALKVSEVPAAVLATAKPGTDMNNELVRHFLIEPSTRGVKLKGCANEPVFGSLSALIYQHSITPLALPCKLIIPAENQEIPQPVGSGRNSTEISNSATDLLKQGAACNVLYLGSADTESLTGPEAIERSMRECMQNQGQAIKTSVVHFKVSPQGITLTDNARKIFFRRHYPTNTVTYCGMDPSSREPHNRRWDASADRGPTTARVFGFVAKKPGSSVDNVCHLFAELDLDQPAPAIVNFVSKVLIGPH